MVAPLIVGASKVVGNKVAASSTKKGVVRKANSRMLTGGEERKEAYEKLRKDGYIGRKNDRYTEKGKQALQRPLQPPQKKIASTVKTNMNRIKAGGAAITIFWSAIGFYVPQLAFWLIGFAGIGLESVFLVGYVVPGDTLFMISYILILCIGLATMVYATAMFTLRGINCFGGIKGLIFALCLTGYFTFVINFFPWFIIWIAAVTYLQNED